MELESSPAKRLDGLIAKHVWAAAAMAELLLAWIGVTDVNAKKTGIYK